jgi:hypothetical protein
MRELTRNEKYNKTIVRSILFGPLVGLAVFACYMASMGGATVGRVAPVVIIGLPFSYLIGGIPAALGGWVLAEYGSRFNRLPAWLPIVLSVPCLVLTGLTMRDTYFGIGGLLALSIIPALFCWLICRDFWKEPVQ